MLKEATDMTEHVKKYKINYYKENYTCLAYRFNNVADADVIEYLKEHGIQGVRDLVRQELRKQR